MANWDKDSFIENMREHCNREIALGLNKIVAWSSHYSSVPAMTSWRRGSSSTERTRSVPKTRDDACLLQDSSVRICYVTRSSEAKIIF